jgi:hypothetical protein
VVGGGRHLLNAALESSCRYVAKWKKNNNNRLNERITDK